MTTDAPEQTTAARNVNLTDLAAMLRDQQARTVDIVAPAAGIRAEHGRLVIDDTEPDIGLDGVTLTAGIYTPTEVCDQGLADKLGIPAGYLRRTRQERPDLFDANVNGWLRDDPRRFLIRCLRAAEPAPAMVATSSAAPDGYRSHFRGTRWLSQPWRCPGIPFRRL